MSRTVLNSSSASLPWRLAVEREVGGKRLRSAQQLAAQGDLAEDDREPERPAVKALTFARRASLPAREHRCNGHYRPVDPCSLSQSASKISRHPMPRAVMGCHPPEI